MPQFHHPRCHRNSITDEVPAPPDEAITQSGDVWILGNHRLLCGDSSKPEDLDKLLAGAVIHLVNTDPPYNVKVEPRSNNAIAAGLSSFTNTHHQGLDVARHPEKAKPTGKKLRAKDRPLANDFVTDGEFDVMLDAWFGNFSRVMAPGRCFYCWGGYANLANYPAPLQRAGLYFSQAIVWDKQHPVLTRKDFMGAFEICFYGWKEGAGHKYFGPNNATDLWHVKKIPPQQMEHLAVNIGDRGCLSLFGTNPDHHRLLAEHLTAEYPVTTSGRGRTLEEWKQRPDHPDNHWFDCLVGCATGASMQGVELKNVSTDLQKQRLSLSQLQQNSWFKNQKRVKYF